MTAAALTLNGKPIRPNRPGLPPLTPYEAQVVRFCRRWASGQAAFTLLTSGSTGPPKPVTLSREQMAASARITGAALGLQPGDRALVCLSVQYIAGMMMLVRGFELGLALTVVTPTGNPLAHLPPGDRFEFTALVPLQLQTILSGPPEKLPVLNRMKAILVGGAPVSALLQQAVQTVDAPVYHTYGMTETATHVALKRLNGPHPDRAFVPLRGVQLSRDERGCLTVRGAVTGGKTLVTNDRVALNPDSSFIWLGRIDNVINSGGVKVQVEAVEAALDAVLQQSGGEGAGRRFLVGAVPHNRLGQAVVAVLEGEPLSAGGVADLKAALRGRLDKYHVPRQVYFLPRLPRTPGGKIDRRAALKQAAASAHCPDDV